MCGQDEACPPLELPVGAFLRVCFNGTHRAPWDAVLGWSRRAPLPTSLQAVRPAGGLVPLLDCVVHRRYGWQFMEGPALADPTLGPLTLTLMATCTHDRVAELPDGTRITRTEQEEHRAQQQHLVRRVHSLSRAVFF